MAKEALIRKKAIEILEREKFVYWYPAKVRFQQNDIFGVFDLVCWQKKTAKIKFLQLTTLSNLSARKKKVRNFLKENRCPQKILVGVEIWGWNHKAKDFRREKV